MKATTRTTLQALTAALFTALAILTTIWPDWIELTLHVDPDQGNGSLETIIVLAFALTASTLTFRVTHTLLTA